MILQRRGTSTRRAHRRLRGASAALLLIAGVVAGASAGALAPAARPAGPVAPAQWPQSFLASPQIEGWPNALRVSGADPYQTALAASLLLRGEGGFPYDSPDATSGGVRSLGDAAGWWGPGVCPKSVIVVAGDSVADALAAAALSDPTGRSSEPYVERVAAADPLFDPPGGFARVDTFAAPMLLTRSTRSGATSLSFSARLAAHDLRSGGCTTARQAIIVGGPQAVPVEVESELVSIGYTEVFRAWGGDRYATAVAVALALVGGPAPPDTAECADSSTSDGVVTSGFLANAAVEWRPAPDTCRVLPDSVVLTDGVDGIDALASGWWTSYWQVPVLLHDGSDALPVATAAALSLLPIENIIVLGGTARISPEILAEAQRLSRAEAIRVAGPDRYATSIEMAKQFGGWWPSAGRDGFAGSMLCVAASSGSGRSARGSAEILSAGPWCGVASAASGLGAPARMLPPITVANPAVVARGGSGAGGGSGGGSDGGGSGGGAGAGSQQRGRPTRSAVPIILVRAGADRLPASVEAFLTESFSLSSKCSTRVERGRYAEALTAGDCPAPGFAVAFGSDATLTDQALGTVSSLLSGGAVDDHNDPAVLVGANTPDPYSPFGIQSVRNLDFGIGAFATTLSMSPVYFDGPGEHLKMCAPRGAYRDARWLLVERDGPAAVSELPAGRRYLVDADGTARTAGTGAPTCVSIGPADEITAPVLARAVGPGGATSDSIMVVSDAARRFALTAPIVAGQPSVTGIPSHIDPVRGGQTRLLFRSGSGNGRVQLGDYVDAVADSRILVRIFRGEAAQQSGGTGRVPDTFSASWEISTESGTLVGTANGEAVLHDGSWHLRGSSLLRSGTLASREYGPPPISDDSPRPSQPATGPVEPLRVGIADAYGAGGFSATLSVKSSDSSDDVLSWRADAYINTPIDAQ